MKYQPQSSRQWVMFFGEPSVRVGEHWLINPDGLVQFGLWGGQWSGGITEDAVQNQFNILNFQSTWVHLSTVWNHSSGELTTFINGAKKVTTHPITTPDIAPNTFVLGKDMTGYESYFSGVLDELRIYNRALTPTEVTALYNQGTLPKITSITPIEAVIGKPTIFTVTGKNLSADMGFTVGDCQYSNVALADGTPQSQRFVCTQFGTAGSKRGLIKTKPGGTTVYRFNSTAVLVPSTTPMATITGHVKIGSQLGGNVVLSGGDAVDACLTDVTGTFRCQVPAGWTGTLAPQTKGVKFSPALIYVENAQGEKNVDDLQTLFAFSGTPLDSFPANGMMTSDWKKLTTDNALWKVVIANGELGDLNSYEGRFSFRSAKIAANQNSAIQTTINVTQAADVSFARRVSSNAEHGILRFYIDNQLKGQWSGVLGWKLVRYPLTAGTHTLRWEYKKDTDVAKELDAAWIDALSYPASVQARQVGTTTKADCVGATAGTLRLMTIPDPTCEQVQAYVTWLKLVAPSTLQKANIFVNDVKGIEVANEAVQSAIDIGAKAYGYCNSFLNSETIAIKNFDTTFQLLSDTVPIVDCDTITDSVKNAACGVAKTAVTTSIEFGLKKAAAGVLGSVSLYPYAAEKSIANFLILALLGVPMV